MIELNKTQKTILKVLKDTYKKDTVTRAEINALVKKKAIKNPSWLKSDKYKVGRGIYTLNVDSVESDTTTVDTTDTKISNDTKAAYIVSSLTDNVVPQKDTDFVKFGNYTDISSIVKSISTGVVSNFNNQAQTINNSVTNIISKRVYLLM